MEQAGTLQPVWPVPVKQETSDTPTSTRQGDGVKTQREDTTVWEPRAARGHRKLGQRPGTDSALEPSRGARPWPWPHPGLGPPASETETVNVCRPKPALL